MNIRRLLSAKDTGRAAEIAQLRRRVAEQQQQLAALSRLCLERRIEILRLQQELESFRSRRTTEQRSDGPVAGIAPAEAAIRRFRSPSIGSIPLGDGSTARDSGTDPHPTS